MKNPIVIIGGGLSGIVVARQCQRAGIPYLLLEAQGALGGRVRGEKTVQGWMDHGFHLVKSENAWKQLFDLADRPGTVARRTSQILRWHNQRFQKVSVSELSPWEKWFCAEEAVFGSVTLAELLDKIGEQLTNVRLGVSVTKILTDDGKVSGLVLGDGTSMECDQVVLALPGLQSLSLLPDIHRPLAVGLRSIQTPALLQWDVLLKNLERPMAETFLVPLSAEKPMGNVIVTMPSVKASQQGPAVLSSMLFLSEQELADEELITKKLKQAKRVVAKAFPEVVSGQVIQERILVANQTVTAQAAPEDLNGLEKKWSSAVPQGVMVAGDYSSLGSGVGVERALTSGLAIGASLASSREDRGVLPRPHGQNYSENNTMPSAN